MDKYSYYIYYNIPKMVIKATVANPHLILQNNSENSHIKIRE